MGEIPVRNQLRREYQDKPVAFIAINSGNPKSLVEGYAKSNKFEWPILVDDMRETEKQFGFKISLQNIYQSRIVDPEGKTHAAPFEAKALGEAINGFLSTAKSLFDGVKIPDRLKSVAHEIDMGQYEPGIAEIAALAQKSAKEVQEGAQAMYEKLKPLAEQGLERAKALESDGKKYAAYQEYSKVAEWFKKTDFEKTAQAAMAPLKKDKEVQDELAAKKMLDQAKTLLSSSKKGDRDQAPAILAVLQKKYPSTEAAKEAAKLK